MRAAVLLACAVACNSNTPEKIADKFVDLYFVEIDQKRALPITTGLAHSKLEQELNLVEGVRRDYVPEQAKPSIFYVRRSLAAEGEHARATYDITIRQEKDETHRNALVSLERIQGAWTVANFIVRDGYLPSRP